MTNETRFIRLVPLWIILVATLIMAFWSIQQLAMSVVKVTTLPPEMMAKGDPYTTGMGGMGYPNFNNYCLLPPIYPSLSSSMMPGTVLTKEDKAALEKYDQEMIKYNEDYAILCKADQEKQEKLREKGLNSAGFSSIAVYIILSLFSIFSAALTLLIVRKNEREIQPPSQTNI